MNSKKNKLKKIIPAALLTAHLIFMNTGLSKTDAAEKKSLYNLKLLILNFADYEPSYDVNGNNTVNVLDMIRIKQSQYSLGKSGLETPAETTETTVTTTVSETVTTSVNITEPDVTSAPQSTMDTTVTSVSESSPEITATDVVMTDITTESAEPPVSETTTTLMIPVTTSVTTTTSEPVTTTVTTTTSAPVTTTVTTTTSEPVTTTVTTTAAPVTTPVTTTTPAPMPAKKIISSVKSMLQSPELPSGCEATGLTIAVRWYGYDVSKTDMALKYMPRQDFTRQGSRLIGADFRTTFAGDPSRNDMSYGCYIPCMISTVNNYFKAVGSSYRGKDISGTELEDLFPYVANRTPVVIISTPELMTPRTGDSWYTSDGRFVTWQRGHHCMVIIGYDKINNRVYCADSMMRAGIVSWDINQFKNIYNMKGKNAMIIDTGAVKPPVKTLKAGDTVRFAGWVNSASEGNGTETFLETNVYTITKIHPNTSLPYPVCIGNIGWASYDSLYENLPYYGDGTPSPDAPQPVVPPSSDPVPQPPADNGESSVSSGQIYNIVSAYSGKNLNVDYGKDTDGTNIYQWSDDKSTEQKFKMNADGDAWKIMAMCSSSGSSRMVTASSPADGENVYLYKAVNNVTQQWVIKKISGNSFCIALKAYPGYVLTVSDTENGTASGTGKTSPGNVCITKYTGAKNQLWYFSKTE